jgi:hypothetical protein
MSAIGPKQTWATAGVRYRGRYWGQSGHALLHCICPLMTQSGHCDAGPTSNSITSGIQVHPCGRNHAGDLFRWAPTWWDY